MFTRSIIHQPTSSHTRTGYHRVAQSCKKCGAWVNLVFVGGLLGLGLFAGASLWLNTRSHNLSHTTSLFIGVNAFQIVAWFGRLGIAWPPLVRSLFDLVSVLSMNIELGGPECFAGTNKNTFFLRFFLGLSLPIIVLLLLIVYYTILAAALRYGKLGSSGLTVTALRRAVAQSSFQMALVLYLPLCSTLFEYFDCSDVGELRVLRSAPDVECGSSTWRAGLGPVIVFVAAYAVGIPAVGGGLLAFCHSQYEEARFALEFGFLTNRYSERFYLYELVVLGRKLGVALAVTVMSASGYVQGGATFAVVLLAFVVHGSARPYAEDWHNVYESGLLAGVMAVIVCGLSFQDNVLPHTVKSVLILVLILAMAVAVIAAVAYDVRSAWTEAKLATNAEMGTLTVEPGPVKARDRALSSRVSLHGSIATLPVLDAEGRDEFGATAQVLGVAVVSLQQDSGKGGVNRWSALGNGASTLVFSRDYSSLQYFVAASGADGTSLFEYYGLWASKRTRSHSRRRPRWQSRSRTLAKRASLRLPSLPRCLPSSA